MGHRLGVELAKRAMKEFPLDPSSASFAAKLDHINRVVVAQGLKPDIVQVSEDCLRFRVYNCTFSETAKRFPNSVCKMHNALLTGIFETYFGNIELREEDSMLSGCKSCNYTVIRLPQPTENSS
jgi:predicted ArsR family transcriptional regulator